jgi:diguanylate cyclase (GGDEF)-like protein
MCENFMFIPSVPKMPTVDLDPILESLIKLTSQRDQIALELCLAQVLFELVAPGAVRLYRVRQEEGGLDFVEVDAPEKLPEMAPALREAMRECLELRARTVVATDAATTLVYPLLGARKEIMALIVVESAINQAHMHHSAGLVLQIYNNFLSLINDNERDTLTGLLNRKTFENRIGKILMELKHFGHRQGEGAQRSFFLAVFDIDHFKRVNDQFGHLVGDEVLLLFATLMNKSFREDDLLFRFGGEEFVCVLKNVDLALSERALNRFRKVVENFNFPQVGQVTVSIGASQINPNDLSSTIIDRADGALYFAKGHGRNQVCMHETLISEGKLATTQVGGDIELF